MSIFQNLNFKRNTLYPTTESKEKIKALFVERVAEVISV